MKDPKKTAETGRPALAELLKYVEFTNLDLGRIIANARKEAGISQDALGKTIGAGQSHVARWESGRIEPGHDTLKRIAETIKKARPR